MAWHTTAGGQELLSRTWQTDDGLPRNTITAIAQTPEGYLWLGTPFGVIRFDGVTFTPMEDETHAAFTRARTRVLCVDRHERLWIGTGTAGIIRYDGRAFTPIDSRNGLPHPTISALCEDVQGQMWVGCQDGSLAWVDDMDIVHPVTLPAGEQSGDALQLVRDWRGRLWFTQRGLYGQLEGGTATNVANAGGTVVLCPSRDGGMWVSSGSTITKLPPPESREPARSFASPSRPTQVPIIFEDRQGDLWMGCHEQGVFRLHDGEFARVFPTSHRIHSLFEDRESNLWVGTEGGGLARLRPRLFHTVNLPPGGPQSILSVCATDDGDIWLSAQGPSLFRRSPAGELTRVTSFTNIGTTVVQPHPEGGIWVGTVGWGLFAVRSGQSEQLGPRRALQNRQIRSLHRDAGGKLWLGCLPDGLFCVEDGQLIRPDASAARPLPRQAIWSLADDRQGNLWLGTIGGELWRYDGTQFTNFTKMDGLPGTSIGALHFTPEGDLWIGTMGGGLGRLRNGRFVFADVRHGLTDDVVSGIVDDGLGWFWLRTDRGIVRVRKQDLEEFADGKRPRFQSVHYGKDDGLANVECISGYQPSVWQTRAGEIWFATTQGAVVVNPRSLPTNLPPPALVLEKILVDDHAVTNWNKLKFAYGYRQLDFFYTAPSFTAPEHIRFRHQLVGLDTNWIETGTARMASYPRLAPGRYEFRFTASNREGVWDGHQLAIPFEVTPAYWQTAWFRFASLVLFGTVVAAGVRYRYVQKMRRKLRQLEQARAVEQERMRIARDIHDDLGARLTQMAFLSDMVAGEVGEQGKAGARLAKLADSSREAIRSLDEIVWAVNPRKDSLPEFVDYLSHYANEFFRASATRCRQNLPLMIPNLALPTDLRHHLFLACKEALTNISKHARATEVWLRINLNEGVLEITLEDNGCGFTPALSTAHGNGLANLNTRLAAIQGRATVESQPGRGTRVRLQVNLPVPKAPDTRKPTPVSGSSAQS